MGMSAYRQGLGAAYRWVAQVADPRRAIAGVAGLRRYVRDLRAYRRLPGAERLRLRDTHPQVHDRVEASPYDPHYFFQDIWAARLIAENDSASHVDVGSRVDLVGFLTAVKDEVSYVDIRPLEAPIEGLRSVKGSVLDLPFADRSLPSVSCLHVAEHIGLGRYGDPLDPQGSRRAAAELQRVLAPGGQLLFSGPVGRPLVAFNAHRVHHPDEIVAMFDELELEELSGAGDDGRFRRHLRTADLADADYALGLFRFRRPQG